MGEWCNYLWHKSMVNDVEYRHWTKIHHDLMPFKASTLKEMQHICISQLTFDEKYRSILN